MKALWGVVGGMCLVAGSFGEPALELWLNNSTYRMGKSVLAAAVETNGVAQKISGIAISAEVDGDNLALMAKVSTTGSSVQSEWLTQTNGMELIPVSENEFSWSNYSTNLSAGADMRVQFSDDAVLIAPAGRLKEVAGLQVGSDSSILAEGRIRPAVLLDPLFERAERVIAEQEASFDRMLEKMALKAAVAASDMLCKLAELGLELRVEEGGVRRLALLLDYADATEALRVRSFFEDSSADWKTQPMTGMQIDLAGLVESPYFESMDQENGRLTFAFRWNEREEPELLKTMGTALFKSLSHSESSGFPLHAEVIRAAPDMHHCEEFDAGTFEAGFRERLFLTHVGERMVRFSLDPLSEPVSEFMSAAVSDALFYDTAGVAVPLKSTGRVSAFSSEGAATITLPVDREKPSPAMASFNVTFSLPVAFEKYTLSESQPINTPDGEKTCYAAISNSVVSLRSHGFDLEKSEIYARNSEGAYLAEKRSVRSKRNFRGEFKGVPESVEIWSLSGTTNVTVYLDRLSVKKEDVLSMPWKPAAGVVSRYATTPLKSFKEPDLKALKSGTMHYVTDGVRKQNRHELCFPKPTGVEIEEVSISASLTGTDESVLFHNMKSWSASGGSFKWELENTNALVKATAIFGRLSLTVCTRIKTCSVDVTEEPVSLIQGSSTPTVCVEHNVVWLNARPSFAIADLQAFDASGQQLMGKKPQPYHGTRRQRMYHFWGKPSRVTASLAASTQTVSIPFEIELKEGGLQEVAAAKMKLIALQTEFEKLQSIERRVRRGTSYGDLLAAYHYVLTSRGRPRNAISRQIAHADPVGAAIFGYEAKPYRGYFFRKILTKQAFESSKKKRCKWSEGTFEATSASGMLLAVPVDAKKPCMLLADGKTYINRADCSDLDYIPDSSEGLAAAGWIHVGL